MGSNNNIVILEQCQVAPSPGGAAETLLPLLDFDVMVLHFYVNQYLLFYDLECSKSDFLDKVVPNLKKSLSQALKHFFPLAGKIILPLTSGNQPVSRYVAGDSVSLTIAQSDADFVHLTGTHDRDADEFYKFVPMLPEATYLSDSVTFSVASFQVTFFPDHGVCICFTIHHSIADGVAMLSFLRAWSSINQFNGDSHLVEKCCLPFYDRSGITNKDGFWNRMRGSRTMINMATANTPPTHSVRATLTLSNTEIRHLKKFVLSNMKLPAKDFSSTVIVYAFLWTCFAKTTDGPDDEAVYIALPGDCRARLDPPLPDTYFGNCFAIMLGESTFGRLRDKEAGIIEAALEIREAIQKTFNNKINGVVDISGINKTRKLNRRRLFFVAGSARFDMDEIDFGWGGPRKTESMNITKETVSLRGQSLGFQGLQIGLCMSKLEMDAFAAVFHQGIRESNMYLSKI